MDYNKRVGPSQGHARRLIDYFQILNSGDVARWVRAFEDTWHPDAIVYGWTVTALREKHRRRLDARRTVNIHVIRDIDAHGIEYTTEVDGKRDGPFFATFRDGRIYRVL